MLRKLWSALALALIVLANPASVLAEIGHEGHGAHRTHGEHRTAGRAWDRSGRADCRHCVTPTCAGIVHCTGTAADAVPLAPAGVVPQLPRFFAGWSPRLIISRAPLQPPTPPPQPVV